MPTIASGASLTVQKVLQNKASENIKLSTPWQLISIVYKTLHSGGFDKVCREVMARHKQ